MNEQTELEWLASVKAGDVVAVGVRVHPRRAAAGARARCDRAPHPRGGSVDNWNTAGRMAGWWAGAGTTRVGWFVPRRNAGPPSAPRSSRRNCGTRPLGSTSRWTLEAVAALVWPATPEKPEHTG